MTGQWSHPQIKSTSGAIGRSGSLGGASPWHGLPSLVVRHRRPRPRSPRGRRSTPAWPAGRRRTAPSGGGGARREGGVGAGVCVAGVCAGACVGEGAGACVRGRVYHGVKIHVEGAVEVGGAGGGGGAGGYAEGSAMVAKGRRGRGVGTAVVARSGRPARERRNFLRRGHWRKRGWRGVGRRGQHAAVTGSGGASRGGGAGEEAWGGQRQMWSAGWRRRRNGNWAVKGRWVWKPPNVCEGWSWGATACG